MAGSSTQMSDLNRLKLQEKALIELLTRLSNYKHKLQLEEMRLQSILTEQRRNESSSQFTSFGSQQPSFEPQPPFTDSADDSAVPSLASVLERSYR